MSRQATKTNNDLSLLQDKINLRIESIADLPEVNVLDLFGGEGILWDNVKKQTGKNINVLSVDINKYKKINLQGDNMKFIGSLDLTQFNVIDIDAWGSPYKQLDKIIKMGYSGIIHVTFIQTMFGKISNGILNKLGFTDKMIKKIPSLFNKNGLEKFKSYLYLCGIKEINTISKKNKNYMWFYLDK